MYLKKLQNILKNKNNLTIFAEWILPKKQLNPRMQKPKKVLHFTLSSALICTFLFICSSKGKGKGLTSTNSAYFNKKKQIVLSSL